MVYQGLLMGEVYRISGKCTTVTFEAYYKYFWLSTVIAMLIYGLVTLEHILVERRRIYNELHVLISGSDPTTRKD